MNAFREIFGRCLLLFGGVGLALTLTAWVLCAWNAAVSERISALCAAWKRSSFLTRVVSVAFVGVLVAYASTKPPENEQEGRYLCLISSLPEGQSEESAPDPRQSETILTREWNLPGAWEYSMRRQDFANGFVFPYGTNHLTCVHVSSQGYLCESRFSTNVIASIGVPVAVVSGLTECSHEYTVSNTYLFSWTNAAVNRDTNTLVSASLELLRNGDIVITTNGFTRTVPRELPFVHDGYGQDEAWVRANFGLLHDIDPSLTNVEQVLSVGYANWVDAMVGVGLTNGLYKFTASFTEIPPETTQFWIGDYSLAVTNSGEYVFVLKKGEEYGFDTWPYDETVDYWMQDDMAADSEFISSLWWNDTVPGEWSVDGGWSFLDCPVVSHEARYPGNCCMMPTLQGYPSVSRLGSGDFPKTFSAIVSDFAQSTELQFLWESSDDNVIVLCPNAEVTGVAVSTLPDWEEFSLGVTAFIGGYQLYSSLSCCTYGYEDVRPAYYDIDSLELLNGAGQGILWTEPVLVGEDLRVKVLLRESCESIQDFVLRYAGSIALQTYSCDHDGDHAISYATVPMSAESVVMVSEDEFYLSVSASWLQANELISNSNDSWQEKTTLDDSSVITGSGGLRGDSDYIDLEIPGILRGRVRGAGNDSLAIAVPEGAFNLRYLKAGGTALMTACAGSVVSEARPVQQQADLVYYSCHGYHKSGSLADESHNAYSCDEVAQLWGDVKVVVVAGCSIFDIKSFRSDCFAFSTRVKRYVGGGGSCSPGELWESKGAQIYLGYAWRAPTDSGGGVTVARTFVANIKSGMDYVEAWRQANSSSATRNACAIDCRCSPHVYWYWREENGTATWTSVEKGTSGW